jgi:hypothetical protein
MTGSKLHKGSVIYDATTGTEQGAILHDGTYTSTDTPASTDTLLIRQSGIQKQITYADLTDGLGGGGAPTKTQLASRSSTGSFTIADPSGYDEIIIEARTYQQVTSGEPGSIVYTRHYAYETTTLDASLFSYTTTNSGPPDFDTTNTHLGISVTTSDVKTGDTVTFYVYPTNTGETSLTLEKYGAAVTAFRVRVLGVTY